MPLPEPITVTDLDDPRIGAYRNLKDRTLAKMDGQFLAESEHVVTRLLQSQPGQVMSVLTTEERVQTIAALMPEHCPLYVGSRAMVSQIVGFAFHGGVLAIGRRPSNPTLASLFDHNKPHTTLLVCEQVLNDENLGSLIRIAAGFGVDGLILGEKSCDPYWRRAIRVSMGNVFGLPVFQSEHLRTDLQTLKQTWGVTLVAAALDEDAVPLATLPRTSLPQKGKHVAILVGSESQGLSRWTIDHCDHKAIIPMHLGTDSLNIAIAAAIFLYHFTPPEAFPKGIGELRVIDEAGS